MTIPSFQSRWQNGNRVKPRIYMLEVRRRKAPDSAPIAWLLIEREETVVRDTRDQSIHTASLKLSFRHIASARDRLAGSSYFAGSYSKGVDANPCVSLTSLSMGRGTVFLDPPELRGAGIGSYLMNQIVVWVQQWPEASVNTIALLSGQADEQNKARRNRFYEQFGLSFDYIDAEHREGRSRPMRAAALTPVETWKENLLERDMQDYLDSLHSDLGAMTVEKERHERTIERLRSEASPAQSAPLRWALRRSWWQLQAVLGPLILIALVGAALWRWIA
jgi:GNAT superfamily N-acetyltransferase